MPEAKSSASRKLSLRNHVNNTRTSIFSAATSTMSTATPGIQPIPAAKPPPAPLPVTKPTEIFQNQSSMLAANLHPVLLASILTFSFKSLVRDPVNTLIGIAPTVAIIQIAYCVLCLPSTGQPPPPVNKPGQKKKAVKPAQDLGTKIVPAFLSLVLTLTLASPLLYIFITLFGAPLTTHHIHTLLLSLHLGLLVAPQLFYVHGLDAKTWLQIVSLQLPLDEVFCMSLGACAGAWLGAIPIPLDWDREWQKWPVTIVAGCYVGAVVGKVLGAHVVKGIKIKIS